MSKMMSLLFTVLTLLLGIVESLEISLKGENVYTPVYRGHQYFLFIAQKEATITCSVSGAYSKPDITFLKEGRALNTVLPSTLYKLIPGQSDTGVYNLKLTIDASGYTDIEGNWTCSVETTRTKGEATFRTLCTEKPSISFTPKLIRGVAREGSTVTMKCNCDFLNELDGDRTYSWLLDNATPAGSRIYYKGSDDGYPTSELVIIGLDATDTADYSCGCKIGDHVELNSLAEKMTVMKPPGTPKNLVLMNKTMNCLTISWEDSQDIGLVLDFKISYKKKNRAAYKEVSTTFKHNRYTIADLDPLTEYDVKVAASNNAGSGQYTPPARFKTAQPSESVPVIVAPSLPVTAEQKYLLETSPGMDVSLTCKVNSYPAPIITWWYSTAAQGGGGKQRQIQLNKDSSLPANYNIATQLATQFTTEFVLHIKSTSAANDGNYKCVATNAKGDAELKFQLQVSREENEAERSTSDGSRSRDTSSHLLLLSLFLISLLCR